MANISIGGRLSLLQRVASLDLRYGPYSSIADAYENMGPSGDEVITAGLPFGVTEDDGSVSVYIWTKGEDATQNDCRKLDKEHIVLFNGFIDISVSIKQQSYNDVATKDNIVFLNDIKQFAYRDGLNFYINWKNRYVWSDENLTPYDDVIYIDINDNKAYYYNGTTLTLLASETFVSSINNQAPDSEGNVNLTKEHIGLDKVDNTSDAEKVVKGASEDGSGNVISTTYETKTDATTKQTTLQGAINALQTSVAALTGLDSTNFGGFSIQSTEADAISNIATLYTADGYTDELLWYMAGTSLSSVKAYRYNGSGTPTAISSDSYDCLDFSGLITDVNTLSQNLAALGPKISELDEQINGSPAYESECTVSVTQDVGMVNSTHYDLSAPLRGNETYSVTYTGTAAALIYLYFCDVNNTIVDCLWGGTTTGATSGFRDGYTKTVKPPVDVYKWAVYVSTSNAVATGSVAFAITKEQGEGIIADNFNGGQDKALSAEKGKELSEITLPLATIPIEIGKDNCIDIYYSYISYADGSFVSNTGFQTRIFNIHENDIISLYGGFNANTTAAIAFYSSTPSTSSYIKDSSIYSVSGKSTYSAIAPKNAKFVAVSNRTATLADVDCVINIKTLTTSLLQDKVEKLSSDYGSSKSTLFGLSIDISLRQGNFINGIPNAAPADRISTNRIINADELPVTVKIPDDVDLRLYGYNLYSAENDYTSFISYTGLALGTKQLVITQEFLGDAAGITIVFANATNLSTNITPDDGAAITFKKTEGFVEQTNRNISALEDLVEEAVEVGNTTYYGRKQTLKITDEVHKMNSSLVVSHIHSNYPYTTYNQSLAVWNNKCFCFNDTTNDDGLCVVIDATTGEVLYRVTDVPYCVSKTGNGGSHLNNACFTDQYYDIDDTYPLLLLSRGDYASASNKKGQEMYVMRIVETNGVFEFTHIKTIVAQHKFGTFNPSWCYDAKRKMIWGYILTEDWRWTSWRNQNYRKFVGTNALFKAYDTSYVCVESNAEAAVAANVTITVGSTTRTIAVAQGGTISEVFPYVENEGGTCIINCRQDASAFAGLYYVYSCDANGENKKIVETEALLIGFKAPSLSDSETAIISSEEFTSPSYIDVGTFQGGCCANGKIYLPFHDYQTINGHPISYNGKICLIVDPVSGYIESLIKLVISREPEGCAIYNGELYISHHQGGATDATTTPSFEIYKYSFD